VVRDGDRVVADTKAPLVLYESGFAPRWYVPREDVVDLTQTELQTFCPYKGITSYYDVGDAHHAAWSYRAPLEEMGAIGGRLSFEPDRVEVTLDDPQATRDALIGLRGRERDGPPLVLRGTVPTRSMVPVSTTPGW
jgi:uncharacterized protein (DUF427 family)